MPQRGLLGFGQEPKGDSKAQGSIWGPGGGGEGRRPWVGEEAECCQDPCQGSRANACFPRMERKDIQGWGGMPVSPRQEAALGRDRSIGVIFSSPTIAHVPSSLVRTGVTQLKAGSFLRVPTLHLL